jgi:hypothetical protein
VALYGKKGRTMANWFVTKNGKQHGPFTDGQLKKLAIDGKLSRTDHVRREDQQSGVEAEKLKGLLPQVEMEVKPQSRVPPIVPRNVETKGHFPFGLIAVAILMIFATVGAATIYWFGTKHKSNVAQTATQPLAQALNDLNGKRKDIVKQQRELENRILQDQAESVEKEKLREEQRKLDLQKARLENQSRSEKERQKLADERAARQQESQLNAEKEQDDRRKVAERLFGGISLNPADNVLLSKSLQRMKATVELRGPKYPTLKRLHENKDYVGLVSLLLERNPQVSTDLPYASAIEDAFKRLGAKDTMKMLVKVDHSFGDSFDTPKIFYLQFPLNLDKTHCYYRGLNYGPIMERHPDGIGYLQQWSPSYGLTIVGVSIEGESSKFYHSLLNRLKEVTTTVETKERLGEIDTEAGQDRIKTEMVKLYDEAARWALSK